MKIGIREGLFIVLLLSIPLLAWLLAFKPASDQRAVLQAEIREKKQKLDDLRKATSGISDLDAEIQKLSKAINFLENKLPSGSKEVDVVLKEVWQIAEAERLVSKSVRTKKTRGEGRFHEQPIQIELEGNFKNFYAFLLAVERLPRVTRIDTLALQKETNKEGAARANFLLSIFYEQQDDGMGGL